MNTLQKGSRGDDVSKLQQMLREAGYFNYPTNTGYFGDITDEALRRYQKDRGLKVDGVYGNSTSNVLSNNQAVNDFLANPKIKNSSYYPILKDMYDSGDQRLIDVVNSSNTNTGITPQTLQYNADQADALQARYYNEMQTKAGSDLQNYLSGLSSDYTNDVNTLQNSEREDKNTLDDTEGIKGTWASSARTERNNSLQNTYNNKFNALYNKNNTDAYSKLSGQEYNYGAGQTPQFSLTKYNSDLSTSTPSFSGTSSNVYNPFNFVGRVNAEREAGKQAAAKDLLTAQNYNPFA